MPPIYLYLLWPHIKNIFFLNEINTYDVQLMNQSTVQLPLLPNQLFFLFKLENIEIINGLQMAA